MGFSGFNIRWSLRLLVRHIVPTWYMCNLNWWMPHHKLYLYRKYNLVPWSGSLRLWRPATLSIQKSLTQHVRCDDWTRQKSGAEGASKASSPIQRTQEAQRTVRQMDQQTTSPSRSNASRSRWILPGTINAAYIQRTPRNINYSLCPDKGSNIEGETLQVIDESCIDLWLIDHTI